MASHEEDMSLFPITVFSEIYPSGLFSLLFVPRVCKSNHVILLEVPSHSASAREITGSN